MGKTRLLEICPDCPLQHFRRSTVRHGDQGLEEKFVGAVTGTDMCRDFLHCHGSHDGNLIMTARQG